MNFFPALVTEEHPLPINEELSAEILGLNGDSARIRVLQTQFMATPPA